ncbi:helix-turn-helix domain-containing protein [Microbacterium sp. EST19A]|uniref:helix-turn-helix domain-containing protein n=1 Tax=Microbacterium sp. EST19A TaxID=2862681 RepID=UPI001CC14E59|nr:helix-turn-helix domain-containing protein [Microbacterium sp. EST19A]
MAATDGFVMIPNWVIDDSDLNLHEMAVYTVLLRYRDPKTGKCFPGMTTIADRARISRETVKRTIPALEKKGLIKIKRRKENGKNFPNEYVVATAAQKPELIWEKSSRGQRIPKRKGGHSETLPTEVDSKSRHSETPPRHSETPGVGTPSASKKIHLNKIQEQDMRRTLERTPDDLFTFDEIQTATTKQIDYLNDLYIFVTEHIPEQRTRDGWAALDTTEASKLIDTYWSQIDRGRGGMWDSNVDETHSAYRALSPLGKRWIANGCLPDTLEAA